MQKFEVRSRSNFFSNFGDFIGPINPVFHFHFKNIILFEIGPKLTLLSNISNGTIFLEEEFLWNVNRLRELFRVHLDLSLTM